MKKNELNDVFLSNDSDKDKEVYLQELANAMYKYVKYEVSNKQLDDLGTVADEFRIRYKEALNTDKLVESICKETQQQVHEMFHLKYDERVLAALKEFSDNIANTVQKVLSENLEKTIKDIAYLGNINMIFEVCEKEERFEQEVKEYQRISEKHEEMPDIVVKLSNKRNMSIGDIRDTTHISAERIENLAMEYDKYFHIRQKADDCYISLSPYGKKYSEYILNTKKEYSYKKLNSLVSKNCNILIDALQNSCERGIKYDLELVDISQEYERIIVHKYERTVNKVLLEKEYTYQIKECLIEEGEFENDYGERKYRIPRRWY